jgi:hypothetical protein
MPLRCRRGLLRGVRWIALLLMFAYGGSLSPARAAAAPPAITIHTDELASEPPFMGLGVQWDPYDSFQPTPAQWNLAFNRLDYMRPGFMRVVEPAYDYFGGYDAAHNPVYRWTARHVVQLRAILDYAKSRGISVVLGDWSNPMINGDPRIPADFLQQLHDVYGYTNIRYYNLINEPNGLGASCDFGCWTNMVRSLSSEFTRLGLSSWLTLVGPDNANSWDDTAAAQALDRTSGLDSDNPIGGDSWVTATLHTIRGSIGAYDSHRYATIWGVEHGVYADQVRARREQISNLDSPSKAYFAGEVGLTARQVSPFSSLFDRNAAQLLAPMIDPSVRPNASAFVDSQPHINEFRYGVWMGDMMVQAIAAGLSGASAWDLDDAMHVGGQYGSQNLKQWGFWNSLGGHDGYPAGDLRLRPWYYSWSVLARSFPAGSQPLVTPGSGVPGLRIAAAKIPSAGGYYLSFAVVNDSDTPRSISLTVPSAAAPLTLARFDYFTSDRPVDTNGFAVPAQVLQGVQLSGGLSVQLPSRGLVVLSSLGSGAPVALNDGRKTTFDDFADWRSVYARSAGLRLDRSNPSQFNDDRSRATVTAKAKGAQYLIYRANQITSFELKAYYRKTLALGAYRSQDGKTWTAVPITWTNPAPAVGGQSYLAEILPNEPIPAGTNRLKIELTGRGTELAQVAIQAGRVGPACLARGVRAGLGSLAGIPLGASQRGVRVRFGVPTVPGTRTWRYCVIGGGEVVVAFAARTGASLIASSAYGYRPGGIGPGSTVASLRHRFLRSGLRSIGGRIFVATSGQGHVIFVTRAGLVQGVAIATRSLLRSDRSLSRTIKLAQLRATTPFRRS